MLFPVINNYYNHKLLALVSLIKFTGVTIKT